MLIQPFNKNDVYTDVLEAFADQRGNVILAYAADSSDVNLELRV